MPGISKSLNKSTPMSRTTANLLLLFAGLVWGGGFIAQKTAMDDIGPFLFMGLRFSLAALAVLPFALWERHKSATQFPIGRNDLLPIVTVGVLFFLALTTQQIGFLATTVTNAGVLTGLYVVLVPIIAFGVFRQSQPAIIWPIAFTAFLGIWLLGGGSLSALSWGDWLMLLGALCAAFHVIAMGVTVTNLRRPAGVACVQFFVSGALAIAGFFLARSLNWSYEPEFSITAVSDAGFEILYAALLAGALAFTIMATCQQYTTPSNAAILMSSESLFAAVGGAIILQDRLTIIGYLGCLLLFLSIAIISIIPTNNRLDS